MSTDESSERASSKITVGNISDVSGNINIAAGNIHTETSITSGLSSAEIKQLFDQLYAEIDASSKVPPAAKDDVKADVQDIRAAVTDAAQKKVPLDESFLARRFRNIARMAPDILDVVVASLGGPLAGLGVAAKKIADRAKADTAAG